MIGAKLMLDGTWMQPGVFNLEQLDPDTFMALLNAHGLPWQHVDLDAPLAFRNSSHDANPIDRSRFFRAF